MRKMGRFAATAIVIGGCVLAGAIGQVKAAIWDPIIDGASSLVDNIAHAKDVAEKIANEATKKATDTVNKVVKGDFDGIADDVIASSTTPYFRNAVLDKLVSVTPSEFRGVTKQAADIAKNLDDQYGQVRAGTYRTMYETYKGDITEIERRVSQGDFDVTEYMKYSLWYGIAKGDWSSPEGIRASATDIAKNQYAVYSWYSKHTVKGAAISATRDHIGLTNEAIAKGASDLEKELKGQNVNVGIMGVAILTNFMKESRKSYIGPGEQLEQGGYIISENGQYTVVFQNDCNLAYYGKVVTGLLAHNRHGDFAEYARNGNHCSCVQQSDGNLVVYGFQGHRPVGSTLARSAASQSYFTVVQDDGNVVTYPGTGPGDVRGSYIWASGTNF